jgi:60 kDa SS-A/Ro ribonucleoprotein
MNDPLATISTRSTPQTSKIKGTVPNSAGGFSYPVDDWGRLNRFLILGTAGGSYYASEHALTKDNADVVMRCVKLDGLRTVKTIVEISVAGRNPKQHPVMFALAVCAGADDPITRASALDALPLVARTGTHLFLFARYVEQFRGWGRGLRTAVGNWYLNQEHLELQLAKYKQREGWSHRDLLRLAKPRPERGSDTDKALAWAVGKNDSPEGFLGACEDAATANTKQLIKLITEWHLPWEVLPSEKLNDPDVLRALLPSMGIGALVRNLNRLTISGAMKPLSDELNFVVGKLTSEKAIKQSRIHPINILTALTTYSSGKGVRGSQTWTPIGNITDALDVAFRLAFANVEPANKRTMVALDVSGSMGWTTIAGTQITPAMGSAAMALITVATEPQVYVTAFSHGMVPVSGITPKSTLAAAVQAAAGITMGGTDCSLPMKHALQAGIKVDTFVIYTDSETYAGTPHPSQALRQYREKTGIPAKLIVVGMVSNGFTIADPNDAGMLDVVGFDTSAPAVMADFSAGRI